MNGGSRSDNKLGVRGVSLHKATGKYVAQINIDGKKKYLGLFITIAEASTAYEVAAIKNYGDFALATSMSRGSSGVLIHLSLSWFIHCKGQGLVPRQKEMSA